MIDRSLPKFRYNNKGYSWENEANKVDLKVSDVILWCSSYDLTKPPQFVSDDMCLAKMSFNGTFTKGDLDIGGVTQDAFLLYHCLIYTTVRCMCSETIMRVSISRDRLMYKFLCIFVPLSIFAAYCSH